MARRWRNNLTRADVTPEHAFLSRRQLIGAVGAAGALSLTATPALADCPGDEPNSWEDITTYNNFYEFGTSKSDPAKNADSLTTSPWTVKIDGMVDKPGDYAFEDIMAQMDVEERIYRLRCVEAWSMVVPWNGFELADLLTLAGVNPEAQYVAFQTLQRPEEMPGQQFPILDWPYVEGLTLAEAMHPLTIMATGLYGKPMPNQNGAPIRLVVPWKYGFKSIKSIVRITVQDEEPPTTWNLSAPAEYGFYANVNPNVDHPRWSQATERRVGGGLFCKKQETLMFNGYEEEVASLYEGLDLVKNF